jgi:NAD(P)-dependent dehydrogenase (short-subunit alcohol dehydrogenase family)
MPTHANHEISGKTAVVTGAGRGLGRAVALGLAERGVRIAVIARTAAQVDETVRLIHDNGGQALGSVADVSSPAAINQLQRQVQEEFGNPTILINAAGIFGPIQRVADSDPKRWIETLMINTIGPYLMCRAFVPGMCAAGWGRIVNFSSAAAFHPPGPLNSAYGASKVALNQFTRHLAAELADTGVTANVIHPGEVKTSMWAAIRDESQALGAEAEGYRQWAAGVDASGGDDPQKALDLVLKILGDPDPKLNGKFLWIEGGQQTPLSSW